MPIKPHSTLNYSNLLVIHAIYPVSDSGDWIGLKALRSID
jgi:hypothetical protein